MQSRGVICFQAVEEVVHVLVIFLPERNLELQTNIMFCVKISKCVIKTLILLEMAYGEHGMKKTYMFLSDTDASRKGKNMCMVMLEAVSQKY